MYKRILIPIDGSDTSNLALTSAIALAQQSGGRVRVVHVMDETASFAGYDVSGGYAPDLAVALREAGQRVLQDGMKIAQAAGIEADSALFDTFGERLGETVAKAAKLWNADLVVVGTHGRRGFSRLLMGSGAEQVIRLAPVPVLVVRATDTTPTGEQTPSDNPKENSR